jgi:hypothetical protein
MECGDGSLRAQSRPFARSVAVGTAQASLPSDDARNESPALAVHFNPPGAPTATPTSKVSTRRRKRVLRFGKLFGPRTLHGSVGTYQHFYNFARKNRSRANKTPVELLRGKAPNLPPASSFYPHALSPPTWGNSCLYLPFDSTSRLSPLRDFLSTRQHEQCPKPIPDDRPAQGES